MYLIHNDDWAIFVNDIHSPFSKLHHPIVEVRGVGSVRRQRQSYMVRPVVMPHNNADYLKVGECVLDAKLAQIYRRLTNRPECYLYTLYGSPFLGAGKR